MEAFEALSNYYTVYNEDLRLTSKHGGIEFLTTVKYVEKYLAHGMKIVEIGAGTGRYSHFFARNGYAVDAVELVSNNIEVFKQNTKPGENVNIYQGNAVDLSFLPPDSYDITLVLGPMYHLFTEKDKLAALSEAIRVTKKGGVVFVAYCVSDPSIIDYGFVKGNIKRLLEEKLIDLETFTALSTPKEVFVLHRKSDIDKLMKHFNVTRLHYLGTDMISRYLRDVLPQMDDETFDIYLKYHFTICERQDMVGLSHHTLDIFRKEE